MELRQLRYVVAVAEELHFGRAARREYITASALSQQVARVEREIGATLFDRTPRTVSVTPAGAAFVEHARRALTAADEATAAARAAATAPSGTLVVGFTSHGAGPVMTEVLRRYAVVHPTVVVRLRELDFAEHFTALEKRGVDVLFIRGPYPRRTELRFAVLHREPRVVALPAEHRLARGYGDLSSSDDPGVTAADLAGERFFRLPDEVPRAWVTHFSPWGTDPRSPRISTANEALSLVAAGAGAVLLPTSLALLLPRPDVVYRRADVEPSELAIAWWPGPAAGAFAALAERHARRRAS